MKNDGARPARPRRAETAIDDPSGPVGIRLLVQHRSERVCLTIAAPSLVLPLEASVIDVTIGASREIVDKSAFLVVPKGARAAVATTSPVGQTVILTLSDAVVDRVAETYEGHVDRAAYERYLRTRQTLPRTTWFNELGHRYLFERSVCRKRDNDATRFLETEIAKEVYFLCRDRETESDRRSIVDETSAVVERALDHVERHLFDPDVLRDLPKACAASPSTLLRAFKRELGEAPLSYVRTRRLDEALLLLKSRRHSVGEVSAIVGYRNAAAFSQAFRVRFDVAPSAVRARARQLLEPG